MILVSISQVWSDLFLSGQPTYFYCSSLKRLISIGQVQRDLFLLVKSKETYFYWSSPRRLISIGQVQSNLFLKKLSGPPPAHWADHSSLRQSGGRHGENVFDAQFLHKFFNWFCLSLTITACMLFHFEVLSNNPHVDIPAW